MLKKLVLLLMPLGLLNAENKFYTANQREEIVHLIREIDKRQLIVDKLYSEARLIFDRIGNGLESEEFTRFQQEMGAFGEKITERIMLDKSIEDLLSTEFIPKSNLDVLEIKRLKYIITQYAIEYVSLRNIILEYEKCLTASTSVR